MPGAWVETAGLLALALCAGVSGVLGVLAVLHFGTRRRAEWMGAFFAAVLAALALRVLMSGRELRSSDSLLFLAQNSLGAGDSAAQTMVSRLVTMVCLAIATERAARFLLRREYANARGNGLLVAFMLPAFATNGLSAAFGTAPDLSHQLVYTPIVGLAVFAYAQQGLDACLRWVTWSLLAFLGAGLLMLLVKTSLVAETGYLEGWIPGFTLRYYGFAEHSNTLAPLCFLLMACLRLRPLASRAGSVAAWSLSWVSLILTQSKTSIAIVVVLMLALAAWRQVDRRARRSALRRAFLVQCAWVAALVAATVPAAIFLAMNLTDSPVIDRIARVVHDPQVYSLTGRTKIWAATLEAVAENPVFGYGPGLWGIDYQIKTGLFFYHAHNQYVQTLGESGLVGLLVFGIFVVVLSVCAWKARHATQGFSVALVAYTLLRGLTEVPISFQTPFTSEFLVSMFMLVLIISGLPRPAPRLPPQGFAITRATPRAGTA